ncbi:MAG: protein-L-isoaspartate(D-aspartate) O-methyltransferase [Acidobacteria bacterium]|nr:MAG: protein-L-isoaspartate(D-aspartate) O-methyltransferase [Acidobacteriota bacterium]
MPPGSAFPPGAFPRVTRAAGWLRPGDGHDGAPDPFALDRERMVAEQIERRGVRDPGVLGAMREVRRHLFVPPARQSEAYEDSPLAIGHGQTISQPYIVALMTELARPRPGETALEIGTGCGYQTAVLARLVRHVYSIELVEELARQAADRLAALGYANVTVRAGDGRHGWPQHAPFDIVLAAAAPETVPPALIEQLRPGGRLIIPSGPAHAQELLRIVKDEEGGTRTEVAAAVRFVPML